MSDRGTPFVTMTVRTDELGVHVALSGRLDARGVADVRLDLHRVVADGTAPLMLDLAGIEIRDATGLGLLVELRRRSHRAGRPLRVVAADDRTRRLLVRARQHRLLGTPPVAVGPPALAGAV